MIGVLLSLVAASLTSDVRQAAMSGDFAGGERMVAQFQKQQGHTPESVEAYSWLARGALAAKKYDLAEKYALETYKRVLAQTTAAKLDSEEHLPIALGAAIEVQGNVLAQKEGRASGVSYLKSELAKYQRTSIRTRISKNINLLSLEGKPAPRLAGYKLPAQPTLLFFWAHWCSDCKGQAPILAELQKKYPQLAIVGPTQLYGYVAGGRDAQPAEEKPYIAEVQKRFYSDIRNMPAPVSSENFDTYGASTTPTLVIVDAKGIVQMYHPGRMTFDELRPFVEKAIR